MSKDTPDLSSTTGTPPEAAPDAPAPQVSPAAPAAAGAAPFTASRGGVLASDDDDAVVVGDLVLEPVGPSLVAKLGAEAVGSFLLVLVGLGIALYTTLSGAGALGVALGFGLALVGAMVAFGHVSGGHFNPAVTLGSAIAGRTPWRDVVPYWIAQIIGGALAAAALYLTIPSALPTLAAQGKATTVKTFFSSTASGYGSHSPLSTLSTGQVTFSVLPVLLIEVITAALLVAVFLAATNRRVSRSLAPVAVGLTYAVLLLVASPISNGAINPARATAAAFFANGWAFGQLWLFWVAPLLGAALAGLAYRAFAAEPLELVAEEDLLLEDEILVDDVRA